MWEDTVECFCRAASKRVMKVETKAKVPILRSHSLPLALAPLYSATRTRGIADSDGRAKARNSGPVAGKEIDVEECAVVFKAYRLPAHNRDSVGDDRRRNRRIVASH